MTILRRAILLLVIACFSTVLAQANTCDVIVQQAISAVQNNCSSTGRDQACYGYVSLQATPRQSAQNFNFSQTGDLANVADLDSLRLSALDPVNNIWGVALMMLQANLPDALPGQNVAFIMFGDVQVQNASQGSANLPTIYATASSNLDLRSSPSADASVIGTMTAGEATTVIGRNQDSSWVQVQLRDSSTQGWVAANLVSLVGDISQLPEADTSASETPYAPMQAFYFRTGIASTTCTAAPPDGILVQTPQGAGTIQLRANDVDIKLGSTAFMQAQPGGNMTISILEGEGHATADGKTSTIPAGSQVQIPLDADGHVAGRAGDVQPYDASALQSLPIQLLPMTISIAPPATEDQIRAANLPSVVPGVGTFGLAGDIGSMVNMPLDQFCPLFDQAAQQSGFSRDGYIDLLNHALTQMTGDSKAQIAQVIQMAQQCP